jgi:hypothetical protein
MFYRGYSRHGYSGRSYGGRSSSPSASVTEQGGMLVLHSSYNAELVGWVKSLPQSDRAYKPDEKTWTIDPKHGNALKDAVSRYLGIDVTIPQVAQVSLAEQLATFEVRYLGGARLRGTDGERTATGFSSGEWKLIFPETVMRKWFGEHDAKPGEMPTKYGILGVPATSSGAELKSAYRKMTMIWHPDRNHDPDATDQFRLVQEAYEILSDPGKRQKYDVGLKFQASLGGQRISNEKVYFSPLRCGIITGLFKPVAGNRFVVQRIDGWKDIIVGGKMLVPTFERGAKTFIEQWVEVAR